MKSNRVAGVFTGLGWVAGMFVGSYLNSSTKISLVDVNDDSRQDVIVESRLGSRSIYIQQEDGNAISLNEYLQAEKKFLKAEIEAYKDSIEARVEERK